MKKYPISLNYYLENISKLPTLVKIPNQGCRSKFKEMIKFIDKTLIKVGEANQPLMISLAYMSYKDINTHLIKIFTEKIHNFNIVDLYNLKIDLKELIELAETKYDSLDSNFLFLI